MGFYDGAKDELKGKLKAIFENNEYEGEMEEEAPAEFNFTGDVEYTVKVEPEDGYTEYYVMDGDGNIIEIFTDEMAEMSGTLSSDIRQAIVAQAQEELGDMSAVEDEEEVEDEEGEEDEVEDEEVGEEGEIEEMAAAPMAPDPGAAQVEVPPEGGSTETPAEGDFATTEVAEDYAHNVRTLEEDITIEDKPKLKGRDVKDEDEDDKAPDNPAGVYNEEEK